MTTAPIPIVGFCHSGCLQAPFDGEDAKQSLATHGNYCQRCYDLALSGLDNAAPLVAHLIPQITAAFGRRGSDASHTKGDPPLPFNSSALDDSNWIFARLSHWSTFWGGALDTASPLPSHRSWRDLSGRIIGLPYGIFADDARSAVQSLTQWQTLVLDRILATADDAQVKAWLADLRRIDTLNARWPMRDRATFSNRMICPDDGSRVLVIPPREAGADRVFLCSACGRHFSEHEHDRYSELLTAVLKTNSKKRPLTATDLLEAC
jgi:hypothetical protein